MRQDQPNRRAGGRPGDARRRVTRLDSAQGKSASSLTAATPQVDRVRLLLVLYVSVTFACALPDQSAPTVPCGLRLLRCAARRRGIPECPTPQRSRAACPRYTCSRRRVARRCRIPIVWGYTRAGGSTHRV